MSNVLLSTVKVELMKAIWTLNGGTALNLGVTQAGSKLVWKRPATTITVHELGDSAVNLVGRGWQGSVELQLKSSVIDNLVVALGTAKTTVVGPPSKAAIGLDPRAGIVLPYGELRLHPLDLPDADVSRDWTIFRGQVEPDATLDYIATEALLFPMKMVATVVQDEATGKVKIAQFGDPTVAIDFDAGMEEAA